MSYDDGRTWPPVRSAPGGAGWLARLTHPRGDGFASLRASVTDAAGNAVRQTAVRAYRIAPRPVSDENTATTITAG